MKDYLKRNVWKFTALVALAILTIWVINDEGIKAILYSLIAGLAVSFFSDTPTLIKEIAKENSNLLVNTKFLDNFSKDRLVEIRKKALSIMYRNVDSPIIKEIQDLENHLTDEINKPYYEFFHEETTYDTAQNLKKVRKKFRLVATTDEGCTESIGLREFFSENIQESDFVVSKYLVKIDNSHKYDIKDVVAKKCINVRDDGEKILGFDISSSCETFLYFFYDNELTEAELPHLKKQGESNTGCKGIFAKFTKSVEIEVDYSCPIQKDDLYSFYTYTHPIKNLRLVYKSSDDNMDFSGIINSSFIKDKKYDISHRDNILTIDCSSLLLPGEGVAVVLYEKEVKKPD